MCCVSIQKVTLGNVPHVYYMCYTCVLHVLYMCYTCVIHVYYMCYTCVIHVLYMCGVLVDYTCHSYTCNTCGEHL